MAGAGPRELSIPRFALRRQEAAASLGISASLFDNWVDQGFMPKGTKINGVVLWDTEQIRAAWQGLVESGAANSQDDNNPFDGVIA
ncbi:hypothetical protein RHE_CH02920 [Rhizobium etli CFN 42]|uniref:Uncharacterized protein n=1 Tax=Rhizobium etli (strain ATCC 51251 / DSM 11541 / JCM 21823 / NBRC 15573 / CFN 42) TaxID=347834 RepID=Q2K649_RHIEC|nr:hypothetical protein [Rhizobium etli]ABC91687.1 hypothetical protein RHE_CH02920 [Rhizobium etli CFN 42]